MKRTKKLLKYIFLLVLCLLALLVIIIKFSSVESSYECIGKLSFNGATRNVSLFFKLEENRWWVGLWGDSDAALILELPNELHEFYSHIEEVGDQLHIYKETPDKELRGNERAIW